MSSLKDLHEKWMRDAEYRRAYEASESWKVPSTRSFKTTVAGRAERDPAFHEALAIEGIERGLADMKAGRIVPHKEAMQEIRSVIDNTLAEMPKSTADDN